LIRYATGRRGEGRDGACTLNQFSSEYGVTVNKDTGGAGTTEIEVLLLSSQETRTIRRKTERQKKRKSKEENNRENINI
jgi:hypothetical protein